VDETDDESPPIPNSNFGRVQFALTVWSVRGANAIIALRCGHLNRQFEDYWEARRAA
jgi:hypothetical protein